MTIHLNGQQYSLPRPLTVAELLRRLSVRQRIAVELNRCIVPRSRYTACRVQEGDQVEIIQAVGGG